MSTAKPGCPFGGAAGFLLAGLLATMPFRASAQSASAGACDSAGAVPAVVAAVDATFDLLLGDGRVATQPGLEFRAPADTAILSGWLSGEAVHLKTLSGTTDRWGRVRGRLYVRPLKAPDAPLSDGAVVMLRRGWALYRPDADAHACRPSLLAAEAEAREKRLGLWAEPSAIVRSDDRPALAAAAPTMIVTEGLVHGVGQARGRVYLNLGKMRTVDLAIVILGRNISAFEAQGLEPRKLVGHRIRVRGLLDRRFGPQIEIATPDALELVEATGADGPAEEARRRTD